MSIEDLFELTKIDHWFLAEIEDLILAEAELTTRTASSLSKQEWLVAKTKGFSDPRLAALMNTTES